jgi:hypothetical protein
MSWFTRKSPLNQVLLFRLYRWHRNIGSHRKQSSGQKAQALVSVEHNFG